MKKFPMIIGFAIVLIILFTLHNSLAQPTHHASYTPPTNKILSVSTNQNGLQIITEKGNVDVKLFVNNDEIRIIPDLSEIKGGYKFGWQFTSDYAGLTIPIKTAITTNLDLGNVRCINGNLCVPRLEKDGFVIDFYDFFDLSIENITVSKTAQGYAVEFNYLIPENGNVNIDPSSFGGGGIFVTGTGNTCETIANDVGDPSVFLWNNQTRECWLMSNLYVEGELLLENVTFHINVTTNGQYDFLIENGGNVTVNYSVITNGVANTTKYLFKVQGNFTMYNSTLEWAGWNANFPDTRGLEIYSPVRIYNSTLHNNKFGITFYAGGSNSKIEDSRITRTANTARGIYIEGSTSSHPQNISIRNIEMPDVMQVNVWLKEARNNSIINVRGKCLDDGLIIEASQDIGGSDANYNTIKDSTFSGANDCERGIDIIRRSSGHLIQNNLIENITGALNATNREDFGIRLQATTNAQLLGNTIRYIGESGSNEVGHGIYVTSYTSDTTKNAGNVTIENNTIKFIGSSGQFGDANAIYVLSGSSHTISGNVINMSPAGKNSIGIYITTGSSHIIKQNNVKDNTFGQIRLNNANSTQLINNTAQGGDGVVVSNSNEIKIINNTLINNFMGVQVDGENFTISYNNFTGNTIPLSLETEKNVTAAFNIVDNSDIINFGGEFQSAGDVTNDVLVKDTIVRNNGAVELWWDYEQWDCEYGGAVSVLNTSYSSINFCSGNWITEPKVKIRKYLDVFVQDEFNNTLIGANVTTYDRFLNADNTVFTNSNGNAVLIPSYLLINRTGATDLNNHTINVSAYGYFNGTKNLNVSQFSSVSFSLLENFVVFEYRARSAIEEGINRTVLNGLATRDKQLYTLNQTNGQKLGTFDFAASLGNQTWGFNYITPGELFINMTSMFNVVNIWENATLNYTTIVNQVEIFINQTKD